MLLSEKWHVLQKVVKLAILYIQIVIFITFMGVQTCMDVFQSKNWKKLKIFFFDFLPPRGTNAHPFEGLYLGLGGEIQKSPRWRHLYCHKLQTATQHASVASMVWAVGGVLRFSLPPHLMIRRRLYNGEAGIFWHLQVQVIWIGNWRNGNSCSTIKSTYQM